MRLINTLEIYSFDYEEDEYQHDLIPIFEDAGLFDITAISDNALTQILKNKLADIDLPDFRDQIIALSGGITLEHNNSFYITPSCCGDISAIHDWEKIPGSQTTGWQQLWIGHPWIYYRKNNACIEFSDYTEDGADALDHLQVRVTVPLSDLKHELAQVRTAQCIFSKRIENALEGLGIPHAAEMAKLMTAGL